MNQKFQILTVLTLCFTAQTILSSRWAKEPDISEAEHNKGVSYRNQAAETFKIFKQQIDPAFVKILNLEPADPENIQSVKMTPNEKMFLVGMQSLQSQQNQRHNQWLQSLRRTSEKLQNQFTDVYKKFFSWIQGIMHLTSDNDADSITEAIHENERKDLEDFILELKEHQNELNSLNESVEKNETKIFNIYLKRFNELYQHTNWKLEYDEEYGQFKVIIPKALTTEVNEFERVDEFELVD